MNFAAIIEELHARRRDIEQAIDVLERLDQSRPKKRGRPRKSITAVADDQKQQSVERAFGAGG